MSDTEQTYISRLDIIYRQLTDFALSAMELKKQLQAANNFVGYAAVSRLDDVWGLLDDVMMEFAEAEESVSPHAKQVSTWIMNRVARDEWMREQDENA